MISVYKINDELTQLYGFYNARLEDVEAAEKQVTTPLALCTPVIGLAYGIAHLVARGWKLARWYKTSHSYDKYNLGYFAKHIAEPAKIDVSVQPWIAACSDGAYTNFERALQNPKGREFWGNSTIKTLALYHGPALKLPQIAQFRKAGWARFRGTNVWVWGKKPSELPDDQKKLCGVGA